MEKQYHELDDLLKFLEKNKPRRNLLQRIWGYIRISFDDITCGL